MDDKLTETVERPEAAIEQLRDHQQQLDADGCMVGVSRQAIDEVLTYLAALTPAGDDEVARVKEALSPLVNEDMDAGMRDAWLSDLARAATAALSRPNVDDPRPDIVGDPICKIITYNDAHEDAVELGYPSLTEALEDLERLKAQLHNVDEMREALESIAHSKFGLQGIQEEYGHDTNAYNFHAMKYWAKLALSYQHKALAALNGSAS